MNAYEIFSKVGVEPSILNRVNHIKILFAVYFIPTNEHGGAFAPYVVKEDVFKKILALLFLLLLSLSF